MASFLGEYSLNVSGKNIFSASERPKRFTRAVYSFIKNKYENKELIICSDGCDITNRIYNTAFKDIENIKLVELEKKEDFSGEVRQSGLEVATGDYICYLDSDDTIGDEHIANLAHQIKDKNGAYIDWVYYNDYIRNNQGFLLERNVEPELGKIGTSSFAHKRNINLQWQDGYNHDYHTIDKYLLTPMKKTKKIHGLQYVVRHVSVLGIDN